MSRLLPSLAARSARAARTTSLTIALSVGALLSNGCMSAGGPGWNAQPNQANAGNSTAASPANPSTPDPNKTTGSANVHASGTNASPSGANPAATEEERLTRLAAVEAFLRRTEEYVGGDSNSGSQSGTTNDRASARSHVVNANGLIGTRPAGAANPGMQMHQQFANANQADWDGRNGGQHAAATNTNAANQVQSNQPTTLANTGSEIALPTQPFGSAGNVSNLAGRPGGVPVIQSVTVRAGSASLASTVEQTNPAAPTAMSNAATQLHPPVRPITVDTLIEQAREQASKSNDFDAQWRLSMLQLALGRDDEAARLVADLSPDTRDIFREVVRTAAAGRAAARDPMLIDASLLAEVDALRTRLAAKADPIVEHLAFCRRVVTFGRYDEMAATDFVAGRVTPAIVYCEVSNFASEKRDDGMYHTELSTRLAVLSAEGRLMWEHNEPEITDVCRRRRRDFFFTPRINLPATLPAGGYVLKVYVEDKLSGKANEGTLSFTMMEQAAVNSRGG